MSMGDRGWRDSQENYCDGYVLNIAGSTATALQGQDYKQPACIFAISFTPGESVTTGDISFLNGSATADTNPQIWRAVISSGTVAFPPYVVDFARGLVFDTGIIVSATTVTGALSVQYKSRYS